MVIGVLDQKAPVANQAALNTRICRGNVALVIVGTRRLHGGHMGKPSPTGPDIMTRPWVSVYLVGK
jgi:hypothetical protein